MDGGEFVCERLVAGEVNVLVGVCRLAVDVKIERAICVADDCDIEHGYAVVLLDFFSPLYVWVYGVEIVVKRKDVVVVDGCDGVVGLPYNASTTTVKLPLENIRDFFSRLSTFK